MRIWLLLLTMVLVPWAYASDKTDAAVVAGTQWLRQLDNDDYQAAYRQSGQLMRAKVAFEHWLQAVQQARAPLGPVSSRQLTYGALEKALPGLARGEYAVLRFRTVFGPDRTLTENVTLMLEDDGNWHTIGYHLQ